VTKTRLREFLRELNREQGTTILLTTHDMQDIEALASRVVVIDHGAIMHDGTLASLTDRYGGGKLLRLTLSRAIELDQHADLPRQGIVWTQRSPVEVVAALERDIDCPATLQRVLGLLPVADIAIEEPSIEEVVKALYGGRAG
jgi:ABC-2 type transport system ATP-binding protein